MKVSNNVMTNMGFKAQTKINAPDSMLSKEEQEYFKSLGSLVGYEDDTLEITVSELHPVSFSPDSQYYTVTKEYKTNNEDIEIQRYIQVEIPYIKKDTAIKNHTPFNYLQSVFARMLK